MPTFIPPQQRKAWTALAALPGAQSHHLRDLLGDKDRQARMQISAAGITLDYSHQRVNTDVMAQLLALADESHAKEQALAMFHGEAINQTENRAVLHVALRGSHVPNPPWGEAISSQVAAELLRVCLFAEKVRSGALLGFKQTPITDVVNLGIGGSDLGPRMTTGALVNQTQPLGGHPVKVHYVSNVDAWSLFNTLQNLDPSRTAFVVQSKTFTTQETMTLLASAKQWLLDGGCPPTQLHQHLIAVTASPAIAATHGFKPDHMFEFWDWVGGRYSIWSAIGLPLAIAIGSFGFQELLAGARAMDEHFLNAPPDKNMPLVMALMDVWNTNFLGVSTHLIAPYAAALNKFASFLQQMEMESNGKGTHIDGSKVDIKTAPLVWGSLGIDGQHAYFQLIHQGTHLVPIDFIGSREEHTPLPLAAEHHRVVMLNMQAQAQALAIGRTEDETLKVLLQNGLSNEEAHRLAPHRSYPGNIPSSTVWMDALTPRTLGALIALYEHKVFCQAAIWGIHAYDQWGVELGKTIAKEIETRQ
ncbi:MAG: glucose-6-phosphate isomerase [Betaproteobacteria bacterium]